jgi:hypothetical protein
LQPSNIQREQGTLECLEDPATIARVVAMMRKFGWPPSEHDIEQWRRKQQDRIAEAA